MVRTRHILRFTLPVDQQIDAASWREWDMFGLPAGTQCHGHFNLAVMAPPPATLKAESAFIRP